MCSFSFFNSFLLLSSFFSHVTAFEQRIKVWDNRGAVKNTNSTTFPPRLRLTTGHQYEVVLCQANTIINVLLR